MRYVTWLIIFFGVGCKGKKASSGYATNQTQPTRGDWVVLHLLSDPENLNPTNSTSADAIYIQGNIFMSLVVADGRDSTFPYVPALAKDLGQVSEDGLQYTFEIHPAAQWDDGTPVTGKDVEFTFKVIKNPQVDCAPLRPYYEFVEDVVIDPSNPRRFTVRCNKKYMLAYSSIGTMFILPAHIYDSERLMEPYTIPQLNRKGKALESDPRLRRFAELYNGPVFQREKIVGCGPYAFEKWETGQTIILRRKPNWWGDTLKGLAFEAFPDKLVYKVINDINTAITALKAQKIDVLSGVPAKDFIDLRKNAKVTEHYQFHTPPTFSYSYIGMNSRPPANRKPLFTDKRVRRAMAHLVDVDMLIQKFSYGMATRSIGPLYALQKGAYNDTLKPIAYDPQRAAQLLDQAGWKDTDGDGMRDKVIDGRKVDFEFDFAVNSGNPIRQQVAQIFAQEAQKIGVKVNVVAQEWAVYLENQKKHDFDMYYGGWIGSHNPQDLKQIWHTESWASGGSNYVGFGNAQTDKIIEEVRTELDEQKRNALYWQFQAIVYDEQPYIFLTSPLERIIIHKRFQNAYTTPLRPGYNPAGFWTPKEWVRYQ
ncbi:MAG: ABC transporter substrate-binding protein [Bacteroidia bacterium]